ncbi:MAG: hypothetical protein ACTIBE_07940 [Latilactobacillus curvatus]
MLFGRQVCTARKPHCDECPLLKICQAGQQFLEDRG